MQSRKTAADYAAIAVAPILIFLMISSLANFLILVLYRGGFQSRLSWTVMCFTLGIVAVARIAIERDRVYSYGYAAALGLATLLVMSQLVDSLVFCIFILVVVGYLADLIVRDCTLIDDDVDASGEGLIDSGHLFVKKQIQESTVEQDGSETKSEPSGRKTSQPGRTVMYLALGALPMFGLGQFFLRNNNASWANAKYLLAFYLFASLSLLVTTSFVGLRRYLRQRKVEMPADVTIAWLSAGLVLIAAVLTIAYFAPMPGRALAAFELPKTFDSPGKTSSSQFGWGDEGADQGNPDASGTTNDPDADRKEMQGSVNKKGGEPGGSGDGERKDGPAGTRKGGKKSGGSQKGESKDSNSKNSGKQAQGNDDSQAGKESEQQSQGQQSKSQSGESESGESQSGESQSGESESGESESGESESGESESGESESGESQSEESESEESESEESESGGSEPKDDQSADERDSRQSENPSQSGSGSSPQSSSDSQSSVSEKLSSAVSMLGSVLKYLIVIVLLAIVGIFFWRNWSLICQWFSNLFAASKGGPTADEQTDSLPSLDSPPRSFSSFRNPIGHDPDLRRVMIVTFQAFESWSWECGVMRRKEETPAEFTRRVAKTLPDAFSAQLPAHASQVVESYNRIVYGRGNATKADVVAASHVWNVMSSHS
ncbi:DUF4129 domain-containing protein [Rhodopirellula sp.]|nr:DUF4129 domain-containing protein [Rhodopirellula sp.]